MRGRGRGAGLLGPLRPAFAAALFGRGAGAKGALPAGRCGLASPRHGSRARARPGAFAGTGCGRSELVRPSGEKDRGAAPRPFGITRAPSGSPPSWGAPAREAAPAGSAPGPGPSGRRSRGEGGPRLRAAGRCTWKAGPASPCAAAVMYAMAGLGISEDRGTEVVGNYSSVEDGGLEGSSPLSRTCFIIKVAWMKLPGCVNISTPSRSSPRRWPRCIFRGSRSSSAVSGFSRRAESSRSAQLLVCRCPSRGM